MPEVEGLDAGTGTSSHKKKKPGSRSAVPVAPSGPRPVPKAPPRGTAASGSGSGGRSGGSGGRSGGGGGGVSGAEARAVARQTAAEQKAGRRYVRQAETLEAQARALQKALRSSFTRRRDQQLGDITQALRQQKGLLIEGFGKRTNQLKGAESDNTKAATGQSGINTSNQIRERNSAVGEAMAQGAGESDTLAAQLMSLRNWHANQTEVQRGYFDTLRSINSSLNDLEVDTKTALANAEVEANADREQVWTDFFNQKSETQTQLGNVRGQQADLYNQAEEMGIKSAIGSKKAARRELREDPELRAAKRKAEKTKTQKDDRKVQRRINRAYIRRSADNAAEANLQSERAFMGAAKTAGQSWDNPGISRSVRQWDGRDDFKPQMTNASKLQSAQVTRLDKKPEGATLRKW